MNETVGCGMEINVLDYRLRLLSVKKSLGAICKYTHYLLDILFLQQFRSKTSHGFVCMTETDEDFSIVCEETELPELMKQSHDELTVVEDVWVPLVVSSGPTGGGGISEIAKSVIIPLADFQVSIYCLSTYKTDFVLVRECDLDRAYQVLGRDFSITRENSTESIPITVDKVFERPNEGNQELRPITQVYTCPTNTFYVSSMDYDSVSCNTRLLIDLMFYSSESNETEDREKFFSMSIVDQDISLVLDARQKSRFPNNVLFNTNDAWRMVTIGDMPEGLGFVTHGVVAQMSDPIASAQISEYYISSFNHGHVLVPVKSIDEVTQLLEERRRQSEKLKSAKNESEDSSV